MRPLGLGTAVIVILGISALLDEESGFGVWLELGADLSRSEARISELVSQNDAMRREIQVLEAEPAAIDRAIREELDLALPGEIVVRFKNTEVRNLQDSEPVEVGFSIERLIQDELLDRETK